MSSITKLKSILLDEVGMLEKKKGCPKKYLYEKVGPYVGADNWVKYWQDCTDYGLSNYQGSYYCIATLFWGMIQAFGLETAQKICHQKFMINCQATYELFKKAGQVYSSPKVGDIAVFWNGSRFHHAEFVLDVKGDIFKTFGANTNANSAIRNGGGCYAPKTYSIKAAKNAGHKFLRPNYPNLFEEGWVKDNAGWKYRLSDGSFANNQWMYIDGRWYVFINEYMVTGWYYDSNGQWYYMNADGTMSQGNWVLTNGKWYYTSNTGEMHTGWLQDKDTWYYMNSDGEMLTGWQYIGDKWYVFDQSGKMLSNTWFLDSTGKWYYLSSTGAMKTSQWIQQSDGQFYYIDKNGVMANEAYIKDQFKDLWYWVGENGAYMPEWDTTTPDFNKYKLVK